MATLYNFVFVMMKSTLRDRMLHALLASGILLFALVPSFSLFSMRQVQELSITLSLSAISFVLLVFTLLLGSSSIWRDIERKYTTSVLGLPVSRASYVVGKFAGIVLFLVACSILLGTISLAVIAFASGQYNSEIPLLWGNIIMAMAADLFKYILLTAVALLFSTISTSFYFPFFTTLGIYLAGSSSQEVMEFLASDSGHKISPLVRMVAKGLYYVLPNFSAFNFKIHAIYSLPLPLGGVLITIAYFLIYTTIVLSLSVWAFSRRELP